LLLLSTNHKTIHLVMGKEEKDMSGKLPDKETTKTEAAGNKATKTTSQVEYSEDKKN
jgi:hypothetical protein